MNTTVPHNYPKDDRAARLSCMWDYNPAHDCLESTLRLKTAVNIKIQQPTISTILDLFVLCQPDCKQLFPIATFSPSHSILVCYFRGASFFAMVQ